MAVAAGLLGVVHTALGAPPNAPHALKARETDGVVDLRWRDRSANETHFELQRAPLGGDFEVIETLPANTEQHTDAIPPGSAQVYRIRAGNADGNSNFSNRCFVNADPARPTQLTARRTASGIRLEWSHAGPAPTGFDVQRREAGTARYETVATVQGDTTEYLDEDADDDTAYDYRVRARGRPAVCIGHSGYSARIRVRPESCPTGPLTDLRLQCPDRQYVYRRPGEVARLTTTGSIVRIRGKVFGTALPFDLVVLTGNGPSTTMVTFDTACVPEVDVCLVLPIAEDEICTTDGDCVPNDTGLSGDLTAELRQGGQTLRLRFGPLTDDFGFDRSAVSR
jgi:hypothetical protein